MPNAAQHTIKYRKEGDYGQEIARVYPVEYLNNAVRCCQACVFGPKWGYEHSEDCKNSKKAA